MTAVTSNTFHVPNRAAVSSCCLQQGGCQGWLQALQVARPLAVQLATGAAGGTRWHVQRSGCAAGHRGSRWAALLPAGPSSPALQPKPCQLSCFLALNPVPASTNRSQPHSLPAGLLLLGGALALLRGCEGAGQPLPGLPRHRHTQRLDLEVGAVAATCACGQKMGSRPVGVRQPEGRLSF